MIPKVTVMKRYILRKGRQIERILTRTLIKKINKQHKIVRLLNFHFLSFFLFAKKCKNIYDFSIKLLSPFLSTFFPKSSLERKPKFLFTAS